MNKIILASGSPRRRELLSKITPDFTVIPADVEEIVPEGTLVPLISECLAELKAGFLAEQYPDALVIGADTTVVLEDEVMGKPVDIEDARRMLRQLSGRDHFVYTGCSLQYKGRKVSFTEAVRVTFYPLTDAEIEDYIASGDPMDKAGAYGIQNGACLFVKKIEGDYNAVIGLPVARLYHEIKEFMNE